MQKVRLRLGSMIRKEANTPAKCHMRSWVQGLFLHLLLLAVFATSNQRFCSGMFGIHLFKLWKHPAPMDKSINFYSRSAQCIHRHPLHCQKLMVGRTSRILLSPRLLSQDDAIQHSLSGEKSVKSKAIDCSRSVFLFVFSRVQKYLLCDVDTGRRRTWTSRIRWRKWCLAQQVMFIMVVACCCFLVPVAQDGGNYCVTYTVPGTCLIGSIQMDPNGSTWQF